MWILCTRDLVDCYLPGVQYAQLRPMRWVDHMGLPGSLHRLAMSEALDLASFTSSPKVLTHTITPTGFIIQLTSDVAQHLAASRGDADPPLYWWIELVHTNARFPVIPQTESDEKRCDRIVGGVTRIASAKDIREALLSINWSFASTVLDLFRQVGLASIEGRALYYPVNKTLCTSLRLLYPHPAIVLHEAVKKRGPWVVTLDSVTPEQLEEWLGDPTAKLGPAWHPGPRDIPGRDLNERLRMDSNLVHRLGLVQNRSTSPSQLSSADTTLDGESVVSET